ncbi:MAG: NUDIX domain-containing protein [Actinomycetota bacterium]
MTANDDPVGRVDGPGPGSGADPGDEPVEWVDDRGGVIEIVSRRRMRAEGLRHRATYVVVVVGPPDRFADPGSADRLAPDTEVVVHLRADWKDVAPSHWDLAFGGVCAPGEGWERSARRELAEEAGIELAPDHPLVDLGPVDFREPASGTDPGTSILGRSFLVAWPDEPVSVDGEAVAFDRVKLGELTEWLTTVTVCADSATDVIAALLARLDGSA